MHVHSEHVNTVTSFPLGDQQNDFLDKITTINIFCLDRYRTALLTSGVEKQEPTDQISNT